MGDIKFNWRNLSYVEDKVRAEIHEQNKALQGILEERKTITEPVAKERSRGKYFMDPKLKDDNGNAHEGWGNVLKVLKEKEGHPAIDEMEVDIEFKLKDPTIDTDKDLAMAIRTKFSFKSAKGTADPVIEGTLSHRRICIYEP
jgi:hypothetical protein